MKFEDPYKILELVAKPNPQPGKREPILNSACAPEQIFKPNGCLMAYLRFFYSRTSRPVKF